MEKTNCKKVFNMNITAIITEWDSQRYLSVTFLTSDEGKDSLTRLNVKHRETKQR